MRRRSSGAAAPVLAALALLLALALGSEASAQPPGAPKEAASEPSPPAPAPAPPPAPTPIPVPDVAARADATMVALREMEATLAPDPVAVDIEAQLAGRREANEREIRDAVRTIEAGATPRVLSELDATWKTAGATLVGWRDALAERAAKLEELGARLDELEGTWRATLAQAREQQAPAPVLDRVRSVLAAIDDLRGKKQARSKALLTLQDAVVEVKREVDELGERIRQAREEVRQRIFEPDQAPIWSGLSEAQSLSTLLDKVGSHLQRDGRRFWRFASQQRERLIFHAVALAAAVAGAYALRERSRRRRATARSLGGEEMLLERPISIAILATFFPLAWVLYPSVPRAAFRFLSVGIWIPILRVLPPLVPPGLERVLYALAGFYLADRVRDFFDPAPLLERLLFAIEMGVALALVVRMRRPARLHQLVPGTRLPAGLGSVLWLALVGFGASLVANLLGWVQLSKVVGEGLLGAAYFAVLLYAVARVLNLVAAALLETGVARRLHVVREQSAALLRGFGRLTGWIAFLLWALQVTDLFDVRDPLVAALRGGLATSIALGSLSFTLGDVAAFVVTLVAAVWVARVLRALLESDVLSRAKLGRGVPHAVSVLAQYAVLLIGFLMAVAAAGFDFTHVALITGAVGVGVGFGLQNVVNNFISGIILLFERPIQVGDTVQQGEMIGEVLRIGIRSSTLRTWQGAEVIVPNATLISDKVVNWTLSDSNRRIDIPIGVAYGSEPERVIALLREVAERHPAVLREPAPQAFLTGFGESSLDFELRIWCGQPDIVAQCRSDVAIAIHGALRDAGIGIPYPQRDLHVVGLGEAAARLLSR